MLQSATQTIAQTIAAPYQGCLLLSNPSIHLEGCPARFVARLDAITSDLVEASPGERRKPSYKVLRQALGYAWSVIVVGLPATACPAFETWLTRGIEADDRDLRWLLRENLKKNRLLRLDPAWVDTWNQRLA